MRWSNTEQCLIESATTFWNWHLIIIKDNKAIWIKSCYLVQGFINHTTSHGAITDNGTYVSGKSERQEFSVNLTAYTNITIDSASDTPDRIKFADNHSLDKPIGEFRAMTFILKIM